MRRRKGGDGQVANSARFHSRITSSLTPCPLLGERPETFYSTIAVSVILWVLLQEYWNCQPYERMQVPLECFQGNRATPFSHL